ncbi:hypothetical protein [Chryseobacterium sp. CH21]|uniref:hypothetical protein n=1 Tax=Chryseobacterium sp. CH21 TaxID=713556 RepID=UPI001E4B5287|nr:hypothetical protein [Chryseobacterium sp. CH21]
MNKIIFSCLIFVSIFLSAQKPVQIAFLSDVHFQDLYGSFSDHNFKGIMNPGTGKPTILRAMDSQLHSTRIFPITQATIDASKDFTQNPGY